MKGNRRLQLLLLREALSVNDTPITSLYTKYADIFEKLLEIVWFGQGMTEQCSDGKRRSSGRQNRGAYVPGPYGEGTSRLDTA